MTSSETIKSNILNNLRRVIGSVNIEEINYYFVVSDEGSSIVRANKQDGYGFIMLHTGTFNGTPDQLGFNTANLIEAVGRKDYRGIDILYLSQKLK